MKTLEEKKISEVREKATDLINNFAPGYTLKFNNRFKRVLGQTRINAKEIHLQVRYVLYADFGTILDTVLHEIAHTFPGCANHAWIWQSQAINLGVSPKGSKKVTYHNEVTFYD